MQKLYTVPTRYISSCRVGICRANARPRRTRAAIRDRKVAFSRRRREPLDHSGADYATNKLICPARQPNDGLPRWSLHRLASLTLNKYEKRTVVNNVRDRSHSKDEASGCQANRSLLRPHPTLGWFPTALSSSEELSELRERRGSPPQIEGMHAGLPDDDTQQQGSPWLYLLLILYTSGR